MLRDRADLTTLRSFATNCDTVRRQLSEEADIELQRWTVQFPAAQPDRLPKGSLKGSYTNKPLVRLFEKPSFGELAILECLRRDGWDGVWVDTYHGAEVFWNEMPNRASAFDLSNVPMSLALYRGIVAEHGRRGGFFDVLAWRDGTFLFLEYKGRGDRRNANERSWISAALRYGVSPEHLLIVEQG